MTIAKAEQFADETAIFLCSAEPGLQHLRKWLYRRRDELNAQWPGMPAGEELSTMQGEARSIAKLIKMIDVGPSIKPKLE